LTCTDPTEHRNPDIRPASPAVTPTATPYRDPRCDHPPRYVVVDTCTAQSFADLTGSTP
jgi:hypothetical protein